MEFGKGGSIQLSKNQVPCLTLCCLTRIDIQLYQHKWKLGKRKLVHECVEISASVDIAYIITEKFLTFYIFNNITLYVKQNSANSVVFLPFSSAAHPNHLLLNVRVFIMNTVFSNQRSEFTNSILSSII